MRPVDMVREALRIARAQPVTTIVAAVVFAVLSSSVLVTAGGAAGAVAAALAAVDSGNVRSIVIRSEPGVGLDVALIDSLSAFDGIESVTALGAPRDAWNGELEGPRVAVMSSWSSSYPEGAGGVLVSLRAQARLAMLAPSGWLRASDGEVLPVVGRLDVPGELVFLEPLVVAPVTRTAGLESAAMIIIVARTAALVGPLIEAIRPLVRGDGPPVDIQSSEQLAHLRSVVEGQFTGFGHAATVGALVSTALIVSGLLTVVAVLKRKDTARRRALGASRMTLGALVVTQSIIAAGLGQILGVSVSLIALTLMQAPLPPLDFVVATGILGFAVAVIGAAAPVAVVVGRDPARELRVP